MKKHYYKYLLSCASGVALLFMQTHIANAVDQNINASAKPLRSCAFTDIGHLEFGDLSTIDGQDKEAFGSMSIKCSNSVVYSVHANPGIHGGASATRYIKTADDNHQIPYLLIEGLATNNWVADSDQFGGVAPGNGAVQKYDFKATIFFSDMNNLSAEAYNQVFSDNVTLTVTIN